MILVTGATGNIGVELIKKLCDRGQRVRAFVRDRVRAQAIAFPGVEFAEGDFSKPGTFVSALEGVDRLFLLIPSSADVEERQRSFCERGEAPPSEACCEALATASIQARGWTVSALPWRG